MNGNSIASARDEDEDEPILARFVQTLLHLGGELLEAFGQPGLLRGPGMK